MSYNLVGFVFLSLAVLLATPVLLQRVRPFGPRLILVSLALRVLGSLARWGVLTAYYSGVGDAFAYFDAGLRFARRLWALDLSTLGLGQWFGDGRWWGTRFLDNLSGLAVSLVGPSILAEFLLFSLLGFAGLCLIIVTFRANVVDGASRRYAWLVLLWPSLWFWPSSVGKEAVTIFAIGLATMGYAGSPRRIRWGLFLAGLALAFAIRPHVAAVVAMAAGVGHWLGSWRRPSARRTLQGLLILVLMTVTLIGMTWQFGMERPDLDELREFASFRASQTLKGGSNIGSVPAGLLGIPLAVVNVWMRPFPWEVHNLTSVLSAGEILILWWLAFKGRRRLRDSLRNWRRSRLLCFALPLLIGYTLMIGLTFGNLGIIARQRTPVFPFLLMLPTFTLATSGGPRSAGRDAAHPQPWSRGAHREPPAA